MRAQPYFYSKKDLNLVQKPWHFISAIRIQWSITSNATVKYERIAQTNFLSYVNYKESVQISKESTVLHSLHTPCMFFYSVFKLIVLRNGVYDWSTWGMYTEEQWSSIKHTKTALSHTLSPLNSLPNSQVAVIQVTDREVVRRCDNVYAMGKSALWRQDISGDQIRHRLSRLHSCTTNQCRC